MLLILLKKAYEFGIDAIIVQDLGSCQNAYKKFSRSSYSCKYSNVCT